MKRTSHTILFFVCLLGLLVFQGCGNPLGTVYVTGVVTVDGAPSEGVSVAFAPKSPEGRECFGVTDTDGVFELTVSGAEVGSGAIPGEYAVTFTKMDDPSRNMTEEEMKKKFARTLPPVKNVLPAKYADRTKTDIQPVTIEKRGKNEFEFALVTK